LNWKRRFGRPLNSLKACAMCRTGTSSSSATAIAAASYKRCACRDFKVTLPDIDALRTGKLDPNDWVVLNVVRRMSACALNP
jgi:hypothetical protein